MNQKAMLGKGASAMFAACVLMLMGALLAGPAAAEEYRPARLSQTLENPRGLTADEQSRLLELAPLQPGPELQRSGARETPGTQHRSLDTASATGQYFHIFDAQSELSHDEDGDGFYHHLRVTFDADVDWGDAHVYARLYLSYEGGPWNHYYTTDLFHILEDASYDDYEVVTQLLEGYPTGYYDVLIELYEADWDEHVASYGPYEDLALSALPLEDQERDLFDADPYAAPISHSHGGGGSLGLLGLLLLGLVGGLRLAGARAVHE